MRAIVLIVVSVLMAGCASPEQRRANEEKARAEDIAAWKMRVITIYGPACESLGSEIGSPAWQECVMSMTHIDDQKQANRERESQARRAYWGRAMQDFGNKVYGPDAVKSRQIPVQPMPIYENRAPMQMHCQTDGGYTSCYGN